MKRPFLAALICLALAVTAYLALPSPEHSAAFVLLGGFFAVVALKNRLARKP